MSGPASATARQRAVTAVGVVVLLATVLLVGTWASTTGPDRLFGDDGSPSQRAPRPLPVEETTAPPVADAPPPVEPVEESDSFLADLLAVLLRVALALVALALVVLLLRHWWRERARYRVRRTPDAAVDLDAVDPVTRAVRAISDDAERQAALLGGGTPRNAIVACWQRFEDQAETAGVPRLGWETSSEFTRRLLGLVDADPAAVNDLGELFRHARFSDHEVTEADRAAAVVALGTIHDGLARRAGSAR